MTTWHEPDLISTMVRDNARAIGQLLDARADVEHYTVALDAQQPYTINITVLGSVDTTRLYIDLDKAGLRPVGCELVIRNQADARLVALTGPAGCGKTTIAHALERRGYVRVRLAGPIKDMLRLLGLTDAQVDGDQKETPCDLLCGRTPRTAMQKLGTDFGRDMIGPDLWVNVAMQRIDTLLAAGRNVVVDDLRFDNEARALAGRNALVFRLHREGAGTSHAHASEAGIASTWLTATIDNDGTVTDTLAQLQDHIRIAQPSCNGKAEQPAAAT